MAHERPYAPKACETWPAHLLQAVGEAFRQASAEGLGSEARLERTEAAYVAAGGAPDSAGDQVLDTVASLAEPTESGDQLELFEWKLL
ncbi:hypothetical protein J8J14_24220 [Roseomonas sp. SSH11]|uniref:Uncharacterized protein n=1 Tax=Pararoseomonas baculiformis TaxID=2820812 RepID=A0ABS4ALD4_9PROT|nr:hypothetical protein [Pararoseomonas baculiformis]MBP0447847.1 hypothetical protein [Pararoseomonas baculiformis]